MLTLQERRAVRTESLIEKPVNSGKESSIKANRTVSLADKYRPECLNDIVGQSETVDNLRRFVESPYSSAFIFSGGTGTGKTSAALALAAELGCDISNDMGGVSSIASGEHTAKALDDVWPGLFTRPFLSRDGWRVLIVNEVERLNDRLELLWLDKLEDMPERLVIVFTTNDRSGLPDRFTDRCIGGVMDFNDDAELLERDAEILIDRIYIGETGNQCPNSTDIIRRAVRNGKLSFRRIIQIVSQLI